MCEELRGKSYVYCVQKRKVAINCLGNQVRSSIILAGAYSRVFKKLLFQELDLHAAPDSLPQINSQTLVFIRITCGGHKTNTTEGQAPSNRLQQVPQVIDT